MAYKILIFTLATLTLFSCQTKDKNEKQYLKLPVLSVDTSTAITVKDYIGTIEGKVNVEIRSQVEGTLQEIYVDEGQYVKEGQKLFKIDPSPYTEELNNQIANENIERAKLKNAKLAVDRLRPLIDNEVIAEVQLEAEMANYEVAQA
ncbi:MAG: efflux RND transporter periplasmic adaptor subunit, partial [Mesonia sp.]